MQLKTLKEIIRDLIIEYLTIHEGSKDKTAKALGISRKTLYRYLKKLGHEK